MGITRRTLVHASAAGPAAALTGVAAAACGGRLPLPLPKVTPAQALTVAVPTGGVFASTNEAVLGAIERVLPAAANARRGRFTLEVVPVAQQTPEPNHPYQFQTMAVAPLLGSGTPPDLLVFTMSPSVGTVPYEFGNATDLKFLRPLDDYLKADRSLALGEFFPAALEVCRQRGQLLAVPLMAMPQLLVYDTRRFEQAGVARPTNAWDWRRFLDAARRLTRDIDGDGAPDEYGFFPSFGTATLLTFIWQNGGDVVSADKKRALLTEPAAEEAIAFFADLYHGTQVSPRPASPNTNRWIPEGMRYADRWWYAMMYSPTSSWLFPADWPLAVAELPQGKQRAAALAVMATLSVSSKAKEPAVAAAALAALAEPASKELMPPARRQTPQALQALEPRLTPEVAQVLVSSLGYGRVLVLDNVQKTGMLHGELSSRLVGAIQYGRVTPAEAARSANEAIQQLLG